ELGRRCAPGSILRHRFEVPRDVELPGSVGQAISWWQLVHAAKDGAIEGKALEGEEIGERCRIDRGLESRQQRESPALGRERQPVTRVVVEKGLLPVWVARAEERSAAAVVDGEREHAVETLEHLLAPLAITVQQHFGVGCRAKRVPFAQKLLA